MTFDEIIDSTILILQRRGRVTYRTLRREFALDEGGVDDLKHEMITGLKLATDEGGETLVWAGADHSHPSRGAALSLPVLEGGPPSERAPTTEASPLTEASTQIDVGLASEAGAGLGAAAGLAGGGPPSDSSSRAQRAREVEQLAAATPTYLTLLNPFSSSSGPSQGSSEGTSGVRPSNRLVADDQLERRQVSVLFCGIAGLASLAGRLAHDEIRSLVRAFQSACGEEVLRHEGYVAQHLGDGVLAYFGTLARQEVAERAVRAGLACVEAARRVGQSVAARLGAPLAARVAIHTDTVAMSEQRGSGSQHLALSEARAVAASIEAVGEPGAVLVTESTRRLLGRKIELVDLGETPLEGGPRSVRLFRVVGERSEAAGAARVMVGREQEVAEIGARLERARSGQGGVLLISGTAGIGKSRMVEASRGLAGEAMTCLSFRCSAFQVDTALHPVIEGAERAFGLSRELATDRKLALLRTALEQTSLPVERSLPLFAALLSMGEAIEGAEPQRQKDETLHLIAAWLADQARRRPVLAIWEDVHWADPSTIELFWLLVKQAEGLPILHLLTSRPEFVAPFRQAPAFHEIALTRFGKTQVKAIAEGMLGDRQVSPELIALITEKTEGVPLFVEEVIRTLLESGELARRGSLPGASGHPARLAVPGSLQESLLPRLERMGSARELAQLAATIGREFTVELLATLTGLPVAAIRHDLHQLLEAELLLTDTRGERHAFKHALIQEVVYHSQDRAVRQRHHERIARVLEELFPLVALRQPEFIAHHFAAAGLHEASIVYHKKAGERALGQSAYVEAEAHFRRAVEAVGRLPESAGRDGLELDLRILSGMPLTATLGYGAPEVQANYARARILALKLGRTQKLFPALYGMWRSCLLHADYLAGLELGEGLVAMCEGARPSFQIAARRCVGAILFYMGQYGRSAEHMRTILSASVSPEEVRSESASYEVVDSHVTAHSYLGWSRWMLGDPIGACAQSDLAVETSLALGSGFTLALACSFASWLHQFRRDVGATRHRVSQGLAIAMEKGLEMWVGWGKVMLGWTYMEEGRLALAAETMRAGMDTWQGTGSVLGMSYFLTMLAEVEGRAGHLERALELIAEAERFSARTQEHFYDSERLRTKGELLHLAGAGRPLVEAALRGAHDEAIAAATPIFALRAASSLVRCLGDEPLSLLEASLGAVSKHRERDVVEAQDLLRARGIRVVAALPSRAPMRRPG